MSKQTKGFRVRAYEILDLKMDLSKELQERYEQLSKLTDLPKNYIQLSLKYKAQKEELITYKTKANYWESQFSKLKDRESALIEEVEALKAALKKREHQLFGKRSEKPSRQQESVNQSCEPKKRGQQVGQKGHGRRDYSHLPTLEEDVSLVEARCPCCGLAYEELKDTEDSEVLEMINVKAYRRCIRRKRYKRCCRCAGNPDPQLVSAPVTEKLIPKSKLGVSIWAKLLVGKYGYQQPLNRLVDELSNYGLDLSMGTMTEGLKRLLPLFIPMYDAVVDRSLSAVHWHADETGWKVFEPLEGKKNPRWYLWIFHNAETVVYKMSPWRSSKVLIDHFGQNTQGGTLNVDRYSAYKAIAKSGLFTLAFCWAHVRRDFLTYAKGYRKCEPWALSWVESIHHLYHLNKQRQQHKVGSNLFKQLQKKLKTTLEDMYQRACDEEANEDLLPSQRKLVKSFLNHFDGLSIFIERPDIPMDNNLAERGLRSSVIGRKNYYGSGSIWSAKLTAAMFTLVKTLKLHGINFHTWLLAYLHECAMNGGAAPDDLQRYLPWNMSEDLKARFAQPPKHENS